MVVDDYGHHPAEIKATLAAARSGWERRLIVVFQPHRYTRTRALFDEFVTAFYQADQVVVMEVYAAGEEPIPGAEGRGLAAGIASHGHRDARFIGEREAVVEHLRSVVQDGDIVITLGAGNVWQVGEELIRQLRENG
jgi:UDP-N-acetylmuramate--alanine ligase